VGLAPGERVALMLPNRSEHVLADLGAVHAGGLGDVVCHAGAGADRVRGRRL
jgi:long-chain acyl-CoA synthetase